MDEGPRLMSSTVNGNSTFVASQHLREDSHGVVPVKTVQSDAIKIPAARCRNDLQSQRVQHQIKSMAMKCIWIESVNLH